MSLAMKSDQFLEIRPTKIAFCLQTRFSRFPIETNLNSLIKGKKFSKAIIMLFLVNYTKFLV